MSLPIKRFFEQSGQKFIQIEFSVHEENERLSQDAKEDLVQQFKSQSIPLFINGSSQAGKTKTFLWKEISGYYCNAELSPDQRSITATAKLNKAHTDVQMFWEFLKEKMPIQMNVGFMPTTYSLEDQDE